MNRSLLFVLALGAVLLGLIGTSWLSQPPTDQELLANYAKAADFWNGVKETKGIPWWTPHFLQGTTLAMSWSHFLSNAALLAGSAVFGPFAGPKIAALLCVLFGMAGTTCFVKKLTNDTFSSIICGVAFALMPPLLLRLLIVEHFVVVGAFAIMPWTFLALLNFIRRPSLFSTLGAAAGMGALALTYAKVAFLCSPALLGFAAAIYIRQPGNQRPHWRALGVLILATAALAALPNLPGLRESRHLVMFEFSPYGQWQEAFASKSAISWIDRDGLVSKGMDPGFTPGTSQGGNYSGLVLLAAIAGVLFFRRELLSNSTLGNAIRLFTGLALAMHWLSFGPRSVLGGQLAFLQMSSQAAHWTIAAAWFLLTAQVWVIYRLFPVSLPLRLWGAGLLSLVYLIVPGFRLIGWLPGFDNLRAPQDFYQIPGAFCVLIAGGIALRLALREIPANVWRMAAAVGCLGLALADTRPYWLRAVHGPLEREVFEQFEEAQDFLRKTPAVGWVFPLSGRYFYLLTPLLSGRPLATEAFNNYLQQRETALLQAAASSSEKLLAGYFQAGGITHILIDKNDPDIPKEVQDHYSPRTKIVFENTHFAIRETSSPGAAYRAAEFLQTGDHNPSTIANSLTYASFNLATVEMMGVASDTIGLRGKISDQAVEFLPGKSSADALPFAPLPVQPTTSSYEHLSVDTDGQPGWIVVTQSYHPDWKASVAGESRSIHRAYGSLLAVESSGVAERLDLRFSPPWWYSPCIYLSLGLWVAAAAVAGGVGGGFLPRTWRESLLRPLSSDPVGPPLIQENAAITRPLIAIPTYCEVESINQVLDRVLAASADAEILVIDDASPDGTAQKIEERSDFGLRTHLLRRRGKLGLGSAYKEAFQWALERNYDAVLEMDADLSHPPEDVPKLIAALNDGHDAAIGSRYLGGVRVINWPQHRLLLSAWASGYVRWLTGMPLTDATSGFKAIRSTLLRDMNWSQFRAEGYGFQVELHYFLWRRGARLIEVPIVFTERLGGKTKMNPGIAAEAALRVLQLSLQRPFHHP